MDKRRKEEEKITEHEIHTETDGGAVVRRTPELRAARAEAEAAAMDVAAYEYARKNSKYQYDPSKEPKGEKRDGFTVIDRRAARG